MSPLSSKTEAFFLKLKPEAHLSKHGLDYRVLKPSVKPLKTQSLIASKGTMWRSLHWKKKCSHFDLKSWVKLTQYWELNWLDIESQIDSIFRVKLTWYWESNWLDIESQIDLILRVKLTRYWESNWQFDSQIMIIMTQIFSDHSESRGSSLCSASDSNF